MGSAVQSGSPFVLRDARANELGVLRRVKVPVLVLVGRQGVGGGGGHMLLLLSLSLHSFVLPSLRRPIDLHPSISRISVPQPLHPSLFDCLSFPPLFCPIPSALAHTLPIMKALALPLLYSLNQSSCWIGSQGWQRHDELPQRL